MQSPPGNAGAVLPQKALCENRALGDMLDRSTIRCVRRPVISAKLAGPALPSAADGLFRGLSGLNCAAQIAGRKRRPAWDLEG